jgi:alcohol dehydrogenase class IV
MNPDSTALPLIAIPTTAGSGTEATHFAVCYKNGTKVSIAAEYLVPQVVIIDPQLLVSQTKYQMAVSGIDAFCQAVESLWNINATHTSLNFASKAIQLVWSNLPPALTGDQSALENLAIGSFYAGKAINITKTTAPHAYSYFFTNRFGLPHGHAVALFFPFFVNYHAIYFQQECIHPGGREYFEKLMNNLATSLGTDLDHIGQVVVNFFQACGLELDFEKLNISNQEFLAGLKSVNSERLQNNPLIIAEERLYQIYIYNQKLGINLV